MARSSSMYCMSVSTGPNAGDSEAGRGCVASVMLTSACLIDTGDKGVASDGAPTLLGLCSSLTMSILSSG